MVAAEARESSGRRFEGIALKKKRLLELFLTGVVIFDAAGYYAHHLPVWPFVPMWVGAMLEAEVGWFLMVRLARAAPAWLRSHRPSGDSA